jgi:hypothetical protein
MKNVKNGKETNKQSFMSVWMGFLLDVTRKTIQKPWPTPCTRRWRLKALHSSISSLQNSRPEMCWIGERDAEGAVNK